jgi:hypothetical protein
MKGLLSAGVYNPNPRRGRETRAMLVVLHFTVQLHGRRSLKVALSEPSDRQIPTFGLLRCTPLLTFEWTRCGSQSISRFINSSPPSTFARSAQFPNALEARQRDRIVMHRGTIGSRRAVPPLSRDPCRPFPAISSGIRCYYRCTPARARARACGHVRTTAAKGGEVNVGQLCESRAR